MVHRISVFKYEDRSKQWPQVLAIFVASLSAICTGLFFSWSSPFILKISNDKVHYNITEQEASYFAVIPHIVAMISCPFLSKLCDIVGRKKTLLLIVIPQVLVLILKAVAKSIYMFYLARSIVGIGDGILYTALPMYIGEVSCPEVRGVWGNTMMFFNYLGQFLINVIGINFNVQQSSYICLVVPLSFVILFSFMPESPYFHLMNGKTKEAKETLRKLRGKEDVEIDFAILQADVNRQMSESGTWRDLVCIRSNRKALEAGIFLRVSQQVSGITAFAMYTKYIFEKSGSNIDSNMSTILYSGLCSVLTLAATFTVDRIGRKVSYIISLILCTFSLAFITVYFYIEQYFPQVDIHYYQWVPVVGMIWYITFCSFGLAVIPTLMLGELFSASIKAKGLTILFMVFAGFNFINTYFFYYLKSHFGFYSPYLFFTVFSFISIFLSLYMIPETTGKTLEEIQQSLKGNKK